MQDQRYECYFRDTWEDSRTVGQAILLTLVAVVLSIFGLVFHALSLHLRLPQQIPQLSYHHIFFLHL